MWPRAYHVTSTIAGALFELSPRDYPKYEYYYYYCSPFMRPRHPDMAGPSQDHTAGEWHSCKCPLPPHTWWCLCKGTEELRGGGMNAGFNTHPTRILLVSPVTSCMTLDNLLTSTTSFVLFLGPSPSLAHITQYQLAVLSDSINMPSACVSARCHVRPGSVAVSKTKSLLPQSYRPHGKRPKR